MRTAPPDYDPAPDFEPVPLFQPWPSGTSPADLVRKHPIGFLIGGLIVFVVLVVVIAFSMAGGGSETRSGSGQSLESDFKDILDEVDLSPSDQYITTVSEGVCSSLSSFSNRDDTYEMTVTTIRSIGGSLDRATTKRLVETSVNHLCPEYAYLLP